MIIYKLTNKITNKSYIGQTVRTIEQRLSQHKNRSKINKTYIANSINKYGLENFNVIILANCESQQELDKKEIELIASENTLYPNGYNLDLGGKGGKKSEEVKKRMSEMQKGKRSGRKGKKYGPMLDTSKMNKKKIGVKQKLITIQKRVEKLKGQKRTNECKLKMSLAKLGKCNFHSRKKIIALNEDTNIYIGFYSLKDASEFLNIKRTNITQNLTGYSKSAGGYIFTYALDNERAY